MRISCQENHHYDFNKLIDVKVPSTPSPYLRPKSECQRVVRLFFPLSLNFQIEEVYIAEGFPITSVITQSISCNGSLNVILELSFNPGIPSGNKTIEGVFQAALEGRNITSLTKNNTIFTFTSKCRK